MSLAVQRLARSNAMASIPRTLGRRLKSTGQKIFHHHQQPTPTANPFSPSRYLSTSASRRLAKAGAFGLSMGTAQLYLGSAQDLFDEKFITYKKPEDLADFYGAEDFMEVFCVFPFMVDFMMRGAEFDDDGTIHAWGLLGPGELEVSIDFDEKEIDTNGDGEPDTLAWFNKREHFHDVAPSFLGGFTLWEMTQNFGYNRYEDGTCVVYHQGENFKGFFPIRLLFQLHAKYVIWATEKYINSDAFGTEDRETDLEERRHNIPFHVFKEFLSGLTEDVERAKRDVEPNSPKHQQLEATIRRLNTLSAKMEEGKASIPRLRTLRSHKTKVSQVHLVMDDKEAKDTIQTAVQQVGASSGQRSAPSQVMKRLTRRATSLAARDN